MDKPNLTRYINPLLVAGLCLLFCLFLAGTVPAVQTGPPMPFPGAKRGREAVTALQDRLPGVASKYGKSAERLRDLFLHDNDLWLDPAEQLLYLCSNGIAAAGNQPAAADTPVPVGPFPLNQTFQLHSLAGATKVIYLDFNGHVTSGTIWNSNFSGGADIISEPYNFEGSSSTFSDVELGRIQNIWARVSEDFAMYNIDVTTEDPGTEALRRSGAGDEYYGIRVVISPTSDFYPGAGGVAYVGSFDWNSDTPTFVFSGNLGNGNEKYVTDAASHETGHTLGLSHDGKTDGTAYYRGHGNWAPIMGVGYYEPITQWSKGEYAGANNTEDDLAVMLNNGASYRTDDHGGWLDSATMLTGDVLSAAGLIERNDDLDVFAFQTETGEVTINADPAYLDPNLDILLQILDDGGNIVGADGPYYILPAALNLTLPAGTYYIVIDGVGTGDPDTGYTDYASLGQYFITGVLPVSQFPPDPPSGLVAVAASSNAMELSWTDNSVNENGFVVERSANGVDGWTETGITVTNNTSYTDNGLSPDTTYYYRVSAYNSIGGSGYTNTAWATTLGLPPSAPSNLTATAVSAGMIHLNWLDNSDNETGFIIQRSANGSENWQEIGTVADDVTAYLDNGLASGTTYFYRVAAYNPNGSSAYSAAAGATTDESVPENPTGLYAVVSSYTQIDLNWLDNSDNEDGFTMERSDDGSSWSIIATLPANSTGYADSTVASGSTYFYRVYASNGAGNSGYSNTVSATTDDPPQYVDQTASQEAALAGTVSGTLEDTRTNNGLVEAITERISGGRPSSRYSYLEHKWLFQVQAGTSVVFFANTWTDGAASGDSMVFSFSTDDDTYAEMFPVNGTYDDGNYQAFTLPGNFSGTVYIRVEDTLRTPGGYDRSTLYVDHLFIRTDSEPGTLPAGPTGLVAEAVSAETINLVWIDNSDNELGFSVERWSEAANGWEPLATVGADTTVYTDNGLNGDTQYSYRLFAFNGEGNSGYSNVASATTLQFEGNAVHIGSLTGASLLNHNRWDAEVTVAVVDQHNLPVTGASVEGWWGTGGFGSCVTGAAGTCQVSETRIKTSVASTVFTVGNIIRSGYLYDSGGNVTDSFEVIRP